MKDVNLTRSFACPYCQRDLRVPRIYSFLMGTLCWGLSLAISSRIGLRDLNLVVGSFVVFIPVAILLQATVGRILPPSPIPVDESLNV